MPVICPTITATTQDEYRAQMAKVARFANRIQIDLTDGIFAKRRTVSPEQAWWLAGVKADFHLMYQKPMPAIETIMENRPNMIIVHAEADGDFNEVVNFIHDKGVKVGVALLPKTPVDVVEPALEKLDHVMIFSGNLGYQGGSQADIPLLHKVTYLKSREPDLEIGWDGGINDQNVARLVFGGVDVLNVGGFIQSADDPEKAYRVLERIAEETGTT